MNTTRFGIVSLGAIALVLAFGCAPRKPVTERDRKEAAYLVSEAQFALTLREWDRAEGLFAKAAELSPEGDYWLSLGATRIRLKNREGAQRAYESALKAYADDAARNSALSEPWLKQAYVLILLGRKEDSRALITKAAKRFPNDAKVRALTDPKEFEKMASAVSINDMAL